MDVVGLGIDKRGNRDRRQELHGGTELAMHELVSLREHRRLLWGEMVLLYDGGEQSRGREVAAFGRGERLRHEADFFNLSARGKQQTKCNEKRQSRGVG